jgi:hypothetical protein
VAGTPYSGGVARIRIGWDVLRDIAGLGLPHAEEVRRSQKCSLPSATAAPPRTTPLFTPDIKVYMGSNLGGKAKGGLTIESTLSSMSCERDGV